MAHNLPRAKILQKSTNFKPLSTMSIIHTLYIEDENHTIIGCLTLPRQKIRDKYRAEITKFLSEQHTPPSIRDAICHGFYSLLESGRNTRDIPPLPHREAEVMKIYENQTNSRWQHFVRGRMVI
jgi:hypothetical protein